MHLRAYPPLRSATMTIGQMEFKRTVASARVYKMQIGKGVRAMKAMLGVLGKRLTTSSMIHDAQKANTESARIKESCHHTT